MLRVIVNHWGGIPTALHVVAARALEGKSNEDDASAGLECHHKVLLTTTATPADAFRTAIGGGAAQSVFHAVKSIVPGIHVVVLGPTGLRAVPQEGVFAPPNACFVPDSTRALASWGIDVCSLHDDTRVSAGWTHDRETLRDARRHIDEASALNRPLLLCINLWSCWDVVHALVHPSSLASVLQAKVDVVRPHAPQALLRGTIPCPFTRFESDVTKDDDPIVAYCRRAVLATETIACTEHELRALIDDVRFAGDVAITATRSLAIGEHGFVGGGAPTCTCAQTFWASTKCAPLLKHASVPHSLLWNSWLLDTVDVVVPSTLLTRSTESVRVQLEVRGRFYTFVNLFVKHAWELVHAFDTVSDPHEHEDILAQLAHVPYQEELARVLATAASDNVGSSQRAKYHIRMISTKNSFASPAVPALAPSALAPPALAPPAVAALAPTTLASALAPSALAPPTLAPPVPSLAPPAVAALAPTTLASAAIAPKPPTPRMASSRRAPKLKEADFLRRNR
jgi:hypothetical protein